MSWGNFKPNAHIYLTSHNGKCPCGWNYHSSTILPCSAAVSAAVGEMLSYAEDILRAKVSCRRPVISEVLVSVHGNMDLPGLKEEVDGGGPSMKKKTRRKLISAQTT